MHLLYPFARRFIAGEDMPSALQSVRKLKEQGYESTIDILGEAVNLPEEACLARDEYLYLIQNADPFDPSLDISIKLTQVGLDIDRNLCRDNLLKILNASEKHTIRFDMEGSAHTDEIITMCLELSKEHSNLGIALQAMLYRTETDVEAMMANKVSVRLCKGAYKEPKSIAFQSMDEIRERFITLAERLLIEGRLPSIATHDEFILKRLLEFIESRKISPGTFYFEMLYGMRRDLQDILLKKGYRVRIYTPYGKSWLPYTLRRLAEKKENIIFVLKNLIRETLGAQKIH